MYVLTEPSQDGILRRNAMGTEGLSVSILVCMDRVFPCAFRARRRFSLFGQAPSFAVISSDYHRTRGEPGDRPPGLPRESPEPVQRSADSHGEDVNQLSDVTHPFEPARALLLVPG